MRSGEQGSMGGPEKTGVFLPGMPDTVVTRARKTGVGLQRKTKLSNLSDKSGKWLLRRGLKKKHSQRKRGRPYEGVTRDRTEGGRKREK